MKIYTATSWKNELFIKHLAVVLRSKGHDVYCFAEQGAHQHIFMWPDVVGPEDDGITCLRTEDSRKAFNVDFEHLDACDVCILYNPCGRDAHLEAGYAKGRGKLLFILGSWPKGEFSNMYHLADGLFKLDDIQLMLDALAHADRHKACRRVPTVPAVIQDPSVHYFAKEILSEALRLDPVDALHDIDLALAAWRNHVDELQKDLSEASGG